MLQSKNSNNWYCSFQEIKHVKLLTDDRGRKPTDEYQWQKVT